MIFGRLFVKRFSLCYRSVVCLSCLSCLSVCNVDVLWPNGWMDQDETWHRGRPRPGHIVLDGDAALASPKGHSPQFSAHVCSGQIASWIKMPLGTDVGLGPGDIVLGGYPPPPQRGTAPNFRPMSVVAKRLDRSRCHLVRR